MYTEPIKNLKLMTLFIDCNYPLSLVYIIIRQYKSNNEVNRREFYLNVSSA